MKLTIEQINKLKEYGFITQVDPSSDILSHSIDTVELGKIWKYINQTDRTEIIEEWLNSGPTPTNDYLTFDILSDGRIYWVTIVETEQSYDPTDYCKTIQYSKDGGETWSSITSSDLTSQEPTYIEVSTGDKILFKGNNSSYALINDSVWSVTLFGIPTDDEGPALDGASFNISGNIMSLIGGDNFEDLTTLTDPYTFSCLFSWTKTIDASGLILPVTTLTQGCYGSMFSWCTSLTTAPSLPATTLADSCYSEMFSGCTSLTTAPSLPATILVSGCYNSMFSGCTSLTTAPSLPTTILAEDCYREMFAWCTSLTTAPSLPATTLANACYNNMFSGCTSLTTAPSLPATTLANACYMQMFSGCTSLTTAPSLPATILAEDCYSEMFWECTSLTTAPSLPATTLANGCYSEMFSGCTSLTTAPELLVETLVNNCYRGMFQSCTSLNYIKCLATNVTDISSAGNYVAGWTHNVAASGTFVKAASADGWLIGSNTGIPSGWTIETIQSDDSPEIDPPDSPDI